MDETIFEVEDIYFQYINRSLGINGVSLKVYKTEALTILGANGSGKSTLLKILDGLYFPQRGKVRAFGEELSENTLKKEDFSRDFRKRVGFVFQDPDVQLFLPSVKDEIAFAPLQMDMEKEEVEKRIKMACEHLGIGHLLDRAPYHLSGGEKKKVALASILTLEPEVWLLDEPTASLDPKTREWVKEFLLGLKEKKKTIILATHDLDIARWIGDRCIVLGEDHRIMAEGNIEDILANRKVLIKANLISPSSFPLKGLDPSTEGEIQITQAHMAQR